MAAKFVVIFILILYAASFIFSDTMVLLLQFLQIFALHAVIEVSVPANIYFYMFELKPALLQFLPNWLSIPLSTSKIHLNTPLKVIDVFFDYNFIRNVGHFIFPFVILIPLWLLFGLLSNRRLVENKNWLSFWTGISVNRYRLMILNDVLSVFYVPLLWFGFMQFQDLIFEGYLGFSSFLAIAMVIICVALPAIWLVIWIRNTPEELRENYWFMTHRLKQEPSRVHLHTFITYVYLFLLSAFMTAFYSAPQPQLYLLLITHLAYISYLLIIRPYANLINLIASLLVCLALVTTQSFYLFFHYNSAITPAEKLAISYPFLVAISVVLVAMVVWALYRCVSEIMYLVAAFK